MSRSYWEHLCWELEKRRTSVAEEKRQLLSILSSSKTCELHEIHPDLLQDVIVNGKKKELFIGRGSFGVVRLQMYRKMKVAVKELLPHTDVVKEAAILTIVSSKPSVIIWSSDKQIAISDCYAIPWIAKLIYVCNTC